MCTKGVINGLMYLSFPENNSGLEFRMQRYRGPKDIIATHSLASQYWLKTATIKGSRYVSRGAWNHVRIIVNANKIVEHWLNGLKVLEYSLNDEDIQDILMHVSVPGNIVLKVRVHRFRSGILR